MMFSVRIGFLELYDVHDHYKKRHFTVRSRTLRHLVLFQIKQSA